MGSLGPAVARSVAEQMRFAFVDEEIIAVAAEQERLDPEVVADAEERRSFLSRVLEGWGSSGAMDQLGAVGVAMVSETGPNPTERYRALIREAIYDTADRGQVVICAHAASIALAGRDGVLRTFVTASPSVRARRVADEGALDPKEAERLIKGEDAARADYLKRFYNVDQELPTHYDLVVSTDKLSAGQATGLVVAAAQAVE
jgi:Cytidylate kinase-like family